MNERNMMKKSIDALCFSILETELFLDTHPHDQNALKYFKFVKEILC